MNTKEKEVKIEEYLVDVTDKLFDTQTFMRALKHLVTTDKTALARDGKSFAYQQGILDILEELNVYTTGKRNFQADTQEVLSKMNDDMKLAVEKDKQAREIYG